MRTVLRILFISCLTASVCAAAEKYYLVLGAHPVKRDGGTLADYPHGTVEITSNQYAVILYSNKVAEALAFVAKNAPIFEEHPELTDIQPGGMFYRIVVDGVTTLWFAREDGFCHQLSSLDNAGGPIQRVVDIRPGSPTYKKETTKKYKVESETIRDVKVKEKK